MTGSVKDLVDILVNLFPSDEELTEGLMVEGERSMRLRKALEDSAADDLVTQMIADESFKGEFRGVDGFIEAWDDWLEAFESFRIDLDESIEVGNALLTLVTLTGVPKGGATELVNSNAAVWFVEGGKLARVEFHMDREMARRSAEAGLPGG